MADGTRTVVVVIGFLCIVAGLLPSSEGSAHGWADGTRYRFNLGLPSSPVFRYYRKEIASDRSSTIDVDGRRMEASSFSSTVRGWSIHVFSWSAALVAVGAILLVAALRSRARPEAGTGSAPP